MFSVFRKGVKCGVSVVLSSRCIIQVATLTGRRTRGEPLKLMPPFPYWERRITTIEAMLDRTMVRMEEENAKIIVVDGPIAAGKTAFIKVLAEEFDMFHIPEPTMDLLYITPSGYDLRKLDDQLPKDLQTYDHRNFCMCPTDMKMVPYQIRMHVLRFNQYVDALAHVMNTGQGVILERSVFSDFAFSEACYKVGYMEKKFRDHFAYWRDYTLPLLISPHIVIYLDVPVNKVQERIKQRNYSYEVNSTALTPSYLQAMENYWKNEYLKEASQESEVLIYNWEDGGDTDTVIEDLETLKLDIYHTEAYEKLNQWKLWRRRWRTTRMKYTNDKSQLLRMIQVPNFDFPELITSSEHMSIRDDLYKKAPGMKYRSDYNPDHGIMNLILGRRTASYRNVMDIISQDVY